MFSSHSDIVKPWKHYYQQSYYSCPLIYLESIPYFERTQISKIENHPQIDRASPPSIIHENTKSSRNFTSKNENKRLVSKIAKIRRIDYQQYSESIEVKPPKKVYKRIQKEGRNANSNLLRMFFRRVEFILKNKPTNIQHIISKRGLGVSLDRFRKWTYGLRIDYRNYIKLPLVRSALKDKKHDGEYSLVLRILLKQFIDESAVCSYLTSRKIKRGEMSANLSCLRSICPELLQHQAYNSEDQEKYIQ